MNIFFLTLFTLIIDIPFGYWRANVRRFSLQFFLAIHIPVALIILYRFLSGTGFEPVTLLFTILAFFLGQLSGSKIYSFRKLKGLEPITSCMVMDVIRINKI